MRPLSDIALSIQPSATLAVDALAKKMKADGIDVIGFGAGEPDFNTPDYIKLAGVAAIVDNKTGYTHAAGMMEMRETVCYGIEKDIGVTYQPNQICVSSGAKHNVYVALHVLLNPGDEVILPAPYWVSYYEAIRMCGGVPVILNTDESTHFKATPEALESLITEKTKCIILNNPSNPTGMIYRKDELEKIAEVVLRHDLYVISDEIYFALTFTGEFTSFAALSEEVKQHTILINGVSKSYSMTGWRIGYSASNDEIAMAMSNYLSHSTGNPSTISQWASVAAIRHNNTQTRVMKEEYDKRRKYFYQRLQKMPGVSCIEPEGAFYIFMNIKEQFGRTLHGETIWSSEQFAANLLRNGLVAVVPGSAFGADGYIRWSYATSMENIVEGLDRFERYLAG